MSTRISTDIILANDIVSNTANDNISTDTILAYDVVSNTANDNKSRMVQTIRTALTFAGSLISMAERAD